MSRTGSTRPLGQRLAFAMALLVLSTSAASFARKLSQRDFPLHVEVESFELHSFNAPISYMGRVLANVEGQEVVIQTSIDKKHYVISCSTQEVGCAKPLPGTYSGRWSKKGLEIFTTNEKGKPGKITYNVVSAGP